MPVQKRPKIKGLEVYEIVVDGDDPRWKRIDRERYGYCADGIGVVDFPVKPGRRLVRYVHVPFSENPSNQWVVNEVAKRRLKTPDRALMETIHDKQGGPRSDGATVMGILGQVTRDPSRYSTTYVAWNSNGIDIGYNHMHAEWPKEFLYVAVVSETPIE